MMLSILLFLYYIPIVTSLSVYPLTKLWPLLEQQNQGTDKQQILMSDEIQSAVRSNVNNDDDDDDDAIGRQSKMVDNKGGLPVKDDRIPPFFNFLSASKARYDSHGPPFYPNFRPFHVEENVKKTEDINEKLIEKLLVNESTEEKEKKKEALVERLRKMLENYAVNVLKQTRPSSLREAPLPDDGIWGR